VFHFVAAASLFDVGTLAVLASSSDFAVAESSSEVVAVKQFELDPDIASLAAFVDVNLQWQHSDDAGLAVAVDFAVDAAAAVAVAVAVAWGGTC